MTAIRDNLCDLGRMEIPRPKCQGMQFVATRGRQGFYKTIRENGAKYGIQLKPQGPKRPQLSQDLFSRPMTVPEENIEDIKNEEANRPPKYEFTNNNNYKIEREYTPQPIPQLRKFNQRPGGITQAVMSRPIAVHVQK